MRRSILCLLGALSFVLTGCMAVSPDGKTIVFATATADGTNTEFSLIGTDGSGLRNLPGTQGALLPVWRPDSRAFMFTGNPLEGGGDKLSLFDLTTNKTVKAADNPGMAYGWTLDGKRYFASDFVLGAGQTITWYDSATRKPIRKAKMKEDDPQIGPVAWGVLESGEILFIGGRPAESNAPMEDGDLFVTEKESVKKLTDSKDLVGLVVLPGGQNAVIAREAKSDTQLITLWDYNPETGAMQKRNGASPVEATPKDLRPDGVIVREFSPDGSRQLVYRGFRDSKGESRLVRIYVVDFAAGKTTKIYDGPVNNDRDTKKPSTAVDSGLLPNGGAVTYLITTNAGGNPNKLGIELRLHTPEGLTRTLYKRVSASRGNPLR